MKTYPYGAVLKIQREWSVADIRKSLESMRGIGMNHVVIWPAIYWWEDRRLPHYPFHTGRAILDMAGKLGIRVTMELEGQITCLEYAPDFLMKEEYYAVDRDGHKLNKGTGYEFLNYNHPEVRTLVHKSFSEAAEAYKGHPALYGYDIYNETKFESFDAHTLERFREWLKAKYMTIGNLNAVWERTYSDWAQVQFAWWMWASVMPRVDYNQFKKENMGMILRDWAAVVKGVDPSCVTIADNVYSTVSMDEHYSLPQDDWNVADSVDEFGISLYPKNDAAGLSPCQRWHTLTGVHSAAREGRFWISELQSHNVAMFNPFSVVRPHELRWWNWEAVSHGAMGIIYWKWDPFVRGVQTLGRGLVDIHGRHTVRAREAGAIRAIIAGNEREFCTYKPEQPRVAILYDKLNHDLTKAYSRTHGQKLSDSIYLDSLAGLYEVLWKHNIPAHYVIPRNILDGSVQDFPALFMTSQVNMNAELARALARYVKRGGTIVCDGKFGMVDDYGRVHEKIPGGEFNPMLGFSFEDITPDELTISMKRRGDDRLVEGFYERQFLRVHDRAVEVLGTFQDGYPAILKRRCGRGRVIYLATFMWYGYHVNPRPGVEAFFKSLAKEYDWALHDISEGELKTKTLKGKDGLLLFVFNYGDAPARATVTLSGVPVGRCPVTNLYTGAKDTVTSAGGALRVAVSVGGRDVSVYRIACRKRRAGKK